MLYVVRLDYIELDMVDDENDENKMNTHLSQMTKRLRLKPTYYMEN